MVGVKNNLITVLGVRLTETPGSPDGVSLRRAGVASGGLFAAGGGFDLGGVGAKRPCVSLQRITFGLLSKWYSLPSLRPHE